MARKRITVPPTAPEFRAKAHALLDTMLDDMPGTEAIAIIADGASGHDVASIPSSIAVMRGIFTEGYRKLFGDEEA